MNLRIFIILTNSLFILTSSILAQEDKIEVPFLNGDIESCHEVTYSVADRFGQLTIIDTITKLDISFNTNGENRLVNQNIRTKKRIQQKYNKDNIVEEIESDGKDVLKKTTWIIRGNQLEEISYDHRGQMIARSASQYDTTGNKISESYYDSRGSLSKKITIIYRNKKDKFEEKLFDRNGSLTSHKYYSYDAQHNLILTTLRSPKSKDLKISFKYDSKKNLIERTIYNRLGSVEITNVYIYDQMNNQIQNSYYDNNKKLMSKYTFNYEYDSQGNWVKMISYKNDLPTMMKERKLSYAR